MKTSIHKNDIAVMFDGTQVCIDEVDVNSESDLPLTIFGYERFGGKKRVMVVDNELGFNGNTVIKEVIPNEAILPCFEQIVIEEDSFGKF